MQRNCLWCDASFGVPPRYPSKIYCSPSCGTRHWLARQSGEGTLPPDDQHAREEWDGISQYSTYQPVELHQAVCLLCGATVEPKHALAWRSAILRMRCTRCGGSLHVEPQGVGMTGSPDTTQPLRIGRERVR